MEKLLQDQEAMRSSLLQWCYASYSEVLVFPNIVQHSSGPIYNNIFSLKTQLLML
jgi:hypothetical protein